MVQKLRVKIKIEKTSLHYNSMFFIRTNILRRIIMDKDADFQKTMQGLNVKQLSNTNEKVVVKKSPKISKDSIENRRLSAIRESTDEYAQNVTSDEILEFFDKLSKPEKRELRNRREAHEKIDLHGFLEEGAIAELDKKLNLLKKQKNCRFLEVVHGKGKSKNATEDDFIENYPIVKNAVNQLLRNREFVKGFCSQLLKNGQRNSGSVIVMLDVKPYEDIYEGEDESFDYDY